MASCRQFVGPAAVAAMMRAPFSMILNRPAFWLSVRIVEAKTQSDGLEQFRNLLRDRQFAVLSQPG